jgi:hypothetical protein
LTTSAFRRAVISLGVAAGASRPNQVHGLAERGLQLLGQGARQHIGRAAGREGHDE